MGPLAPLPTRPVIGLLTNHLITATSMVSFFTSSPFISRPLHQLHLFTLTHQKYAVPTRVWPNAFWGLKAEIWNLTIFTLQKHLIEDFSTKVDEQIVKMLSLERKEYARELKWLRSEGQKVKSRQTSLSQWNLGHLITVVSYRFADMCLINVLLLYAVSLIMLKMFMLC